jgi:hypothetical protein
MLIRSSSESSLSAASISLSPRLPPSWALIGSCPADLAALKIGLTDAEFEALR